MQDPFKPNDNSQLMREAQMGFVVIGLLLCVLVYVAVYRLSGRGKRFHEIARSVPVATVSQGEAYPALTAIQVEEKLDRSPQAAVKSLNRFEENLAAFSSTLKTSTERSTTVDSIAADPIRTAAPAVGEIAGPAEPVAPVSESDDVALATYEASLASGTEEAFEKTLPVKDSPPFSAKPLASTKPLSGTTPELKTTVPSEFQPRSVNREEAKSFERKLPIADRRQQHGFRDSEDSPPSTRPRWPAAFETLRPETQVSPQPDVVKPRPLKSTDKTVIEEVGAETPVVPQESKGLDIPFSPLRSFRKPNPSGAKSNFSNIDFTKAESSKAESVDDQLADLKSASTIPYLPVSPSADSRPAFDATPLRNAAPPVRELARHDESGITKTQADTYTVVQGDSMWSIAQATYGDGQYFRALFEHNADRISGSDHLDPGVKLSTPPLDVLRKDHESFCPAGDCEDDPELETGYNDALSQRYHLTRDAETVFGIARDRLGQASRYLEIIELNEFRLPAEVSHLTPLRAGIRLLLPE